MYKITDYSYRRAAILGVDITPSKQKDKKIDVYKNGRKIASIGNKNYMDYPNYIKEKGLEVANIHRKAYKKRHENDRHKLWSAGYFADKLLW